MVQHTIRQYIYEQGASLVGFAKLRGLDLPGTMDFPYAISIACSLPLETGIPVSVGNCNSYVGCAKACPVSAIRDREWRVGMPREELLDAYTCRKKALEFGISLGIEDSLCGICISVCPVCKGNV